MAPGIDGPALRRARSPAMLVGEAGTSVTRFGKRAFIERIKNHDFVQILQAVEQRIHEVDSRDHPARGAPLARAKGILGLAPASGECGRFLFRSRRRRRINTGGGGSMVEKCSLQTPLISLLLAGALTLLAPPASLQAQASQRACALVTPAELESALGGRVTTTQPQEIPYKEDAHNDHDGVLSLCTYKVGARSVMVVASTQPVTAAGRQRGEAQTTAATDQLRHQGWTVQSHDFGATKCWTGVAPAGTKSPFSPSASCGAVKGSYFVSVTVTSTNPQDRLSMEQAKQIADAATKRLP